MTRSQNRPAFAVALFFAVTFSLSIYFTFAAVQGDYGLFRRIEIQAERRDLTQERDLLLSQLHNIKNKTRRMSDDFLDLDLLDEQARAVLGLVRSDEVIFH